MSFFSKFLPNIFTVNFFDQNKFQLSIILGCITCISLLKKYCLGPNAENKKDMTGKVIIVTGASDGIGSVTASELINAGAQVIYACRNEEKTLKVIRQLDKKYQENAVFMKLDLSDFSSIKDFVKNFIQKFAKLDILVNNAGLVMNNYTLTKDNMESIFQVNTFSPMILTQELLELLDKSKGRVINVASKSHTRVNFSSNLISETWDKEDWKFNKNNYTKYIQYAYSKLGNVFFNQYLNEYILNNRLNISTVALHPGLIHTNIVQDISWSLFLSACLIYPFFWMINKTIWRGAQTSLYLCYANNDEIISGRYYKDCAETPVHYYADFREFNNRYAYINWSRKMINKYGKDSNTEFKLNLD